MAGAFRDPPRGGFCFALLTPGFGARGQLAAAGTDGLDFAPASLTFGSISALFGLTNHIIDERQYTILLTAVIGSAVVPTLIAQRWFQPDLTPLAEGTAGCVVPAAATGE